MLIQITCICCHLSHWNSLLNELLLMQCFSSKKTVYMKILSSSSKRQYVTCKSWLHFWQVIMKRRLSENTVQNRLNWCQSIVETWLIIQKHFELNIHISFKHYHIKAAFWKQCAIVHSKNHHSNNLDKLVWWWCQNDWTQLALLNCSLHDMIQQAWFMKDQACN